MIVVHKVAIIEMAVQNDLKPEWGILFIEEQLPEIALQDIVNLSHAVFIVIKRKRNKLFQIALAVV